MVLHVMIDLSPQQAKSIDDPTPGLPVWLSPVRNLFEKANQEMGQKRWLGIFNVYEPSFFLFLFLIDFITI
jgi:hypothetical protein